MPASDDMPPEIEEGSPFEEMMSLLDHRDDNRDSVADDAVAAVLRGWADDAGWSSPDFWPSGPATQVIARPAAGQKMGALAAIVLSGVSAQTWTTPPRWLSRLKRLRRKPR